MTNRPPETGPFFARDRDMHPLPYAPWYKTSVLRAPQRGADFAGGHEKRNHRPRLRP